VSVQKARYVEEALRLIDERQSSHAVNLREVSRALGCAHTNAYNFFDSLEDLLSECLIRGLELQLEASREAVRGAKTPQAEGHRLIEALIAFALEHPGWYAFLWMEPLRSAPPARALALMQQGGDGLVDLVQKLSTTRLSPKKARRVAESFHNSMHGALCKVISGRFAPQPPERLRRALVKQATQTLNGLLGKD